LFSELEDLGVAAGLIDWRTCLAQDAIDDADQGIQGQPRCLGPVANVDRQGDPG
jgi:hypothetical protein